MPGRHHYSVLVAASLNAVVAHQAQGHVDVGQRHRLSIQVKCHAASQWRYHEQSTYVLATHSRINYYRSCCEMLTRDAQGRITFATHVVNLSPHVPQGIHEYRDGALPHALIAIKHHHEPLLHGKKGSQEPHRRPCPTHINASDNVVLRS